MDIPSPVTYQLHTQMYHVNVCTVQYIYKSPPPLLSLLFFFFLFCFAFVLFRRFPQFKTMMSPAAAAAAAPPSPHPHPQPPNQPISRAPPPRPSS